MRWMTAIDDLDATPYLSEGATIYSATEGSSDVGTAFWSRRGLDPSRQHCESAGHLAIQSTQRRRHQQMLYIAFIKSRPGFAAETDIVAKSRKWWNEGAKPSGLKTIGF